MFDELKEVKYFKEITDFKSQEIERLRSLQKSEEYLEQKRTSTKEPFVNLLKTAYCFRNKSSIIDVQLGYI